MPYLSNPFPAWLLVETLQADVANHWVPSTNPHVSTLFKILLVTSRSSCPCTLECCACRLLKLVIVIMLD